jgi:L-malate glycosyltransferase
VLCAVGDVDGMARAAVQLLRDDARWSAMSAAGAADARRRFAKDDVVNLYEQLYLATLG